MSLPYNKKNIPLAKVLRSHMTKQERKLWYECLRHSPIPFQRQKAIDDFIADFYCDQIKLVVELDGSQHRTEKGIQKDLIRTEKLEQYGITVLRIPNQLIDFDFSYACDAISSVMDQLRSSTDE